MEMKIWLPFLKIHTKTSFELHVEYQSLVKLKDIIPLLFPLETENSEQISVWQG